MGNGSPAFLEATIAADPNSAALAKALVTAQNLTQTHNMESRQVNAAPRPQQHACRAVDGGKRRPLCVPVKLQPTCAVERHNGQQVMASRSSIKHPLPGQQRCQMHALEKI
jgi:hypothetical protein